MLTERTSSSPSDLAPVRWQRLFLLLLGLYACVSIGWAVLALVRGGRAGTDLHSYWYAGQFIRQRTDPFPPSYLRQEPTLPVWYLDSRTPAAGPVLQPTLMTAPTNTAPVMLLLTGLSFFSWPVARLAWGIANLILTLILPLVILEIAATYGIRLDRYGRLVVTLAFYSLIAVRSTIGLGQTSLLIFAWMAGALRWSDRRPGLAGIFCGLALSKYSLALPLVLFLAYRRKWRALGIGLVIQILGLLCLAWITRTAPTQLIVGHALMSYQALAMLIGVHLAMLFPPDLIYGAIVLGVALVYLGYLGWRTRGLRAGVSQRARPADYHLFVILAVWSLLAMYHGIYDTVLVILCYVIVVRVLTDPLIGSLLVRQRLWLGLSVVGAGIILSLPSALYDGLPQRLGNPLLIWCGRALPPLALLTLLIVATWLIGAMKWPGTASVPYASPDNALGV